jgi:hypothetical protein
MPTARPITFMAVLVPMVAALMSASAAQAADLYTPTLFIGAAANCIICNLVNITDANKTVRIRIMDSQGNVEKDTGDIPLPARGNTGGTSFLFPTAADYYYCRFTTTGGKNTVRGSISHHEGCVIKGSVSLPAQ